jgi:hypothetical protein
VCRVRLSLEAPELLPDFALLLLELVDQLLHEQRVDPGGDGPSCACSSSFKRASRVSRSVRALRAVPRGSEFLRSQAHAILALDFTVETAWLRTLYVLFTIELESRRVLVLGVTRNPDSAWVTQQARTSRWGSGFETSGS